MRLRPILAVARKDALDLLLNKGTLMMLLIPMLVAVLFVLLGGDPPQMGLPGDQLDTFYALLSLTTCLVVGASMMPNLLVEEKETKTLRMLLVSPASLADVVAGKLLVGLVYQVLLGVVVLIVQGAFAGQVLLVLLFTLLGSCLGIAVGLLIGSIFKTVTSGGAFTGVIALLYIFPALFIGPFGQFFQGDALARVMPALPTYYLADGILKSLQNQATPGAAVLDASIVLLSALAFFAAAVWILWRQARIAGSI